MNIFTHAKTLMAAAIVVISVLNSCLVLAAPGAHGPSGEHLDAQNSTTGVRAQSPQFQAQSETYELVGTLFKEELSMLIDHYKTNVPVRKAVVQVELGNLKATAKYHSDVGDFSIDDEKMLGALWKHGTHALIISIIEEGDSDLIDAKVFVGSASTEPDHFRFPSPLLYVIVGLALLIAIALAMRLRKNKFSANSRQGVLR